LFEKVTVTRLDFLLNNRLWMFDTHPQYTVALVAVEKRKPAADHAIRLAGVAKSAAQWEEQATSPGLVYGLSSFGPGWTVPLLRDQGEVNLLGKLRTGTPFANGGGRWQCFPVAELHETNDSYLWEGKRSGRPLWKGESFDQYDPNGAERASAPPQRK
jgi:hypothetical protein